MRTKSFLAALITMLLPLVASAEAVEIGGIYYNLISKSKSAEVTVYASKDGYENSVITTADIQVKSVLKKGDVNEDGFVNAKDIVDAVNIIMSENNK